MKIDCNITSNYLKEKQRMCEFFTKAVGNCFGCPLSKFLNGMDEYCDTYIKNNPNKAIEIVQKFSDEHNVKTRLDAFKEMFPNAELDENGFPVICVQALNNECKCNGGNCKECFEKYWITPIESEE